MVNSLTFDGVRLDSLNVGWRSSSRNAMPTPKEFLSSAPAIDGSYDFSTANVDKRQHYDDLLFTGKIYILRDSLEEAQKTYASVMRLLTSGFGRYTSLIFDDTPTTLWFAKLDGETSTEYNGYTNIILNVKFRVKPFPTDIYGFRENKFILNQYYLYEFNNEGTFFTRPSFKFTGEFNGFEIYFTLNGDEYLIDYSGLSRLGDITSLSFKSHSISKNGQLVNEYVTGEFPELPPGITVLHMRVKSGCAECTCTYRPSYIVCATK